MTVVYPLVHAAGRMTDVNCTAGGEDCEDPEVPTWDLFILSDDGVVFRLIV
jgi:hypothetical protein